MHRRRGPSLPRRVSLNLSSNSAEAVPTAGSSCILLPAQGRRRSGEKREGSRRGRQRASRSQHFLLFSPGVQVHHGTCHIKVSRGGTYLMLIVLPAWGRRRSGGEEGRQQKGAAACVQVLALLSSPGVQVRHGS